MVSDLKQKLRDAILPEKPRSGIYEGTRLEAIFTDAFDTFYGELLSRLDKLLAEAVVVYRRKGVTLWTDKTTFPDADENALLISIQPIERRVTKAEILHVLRQAGCSDLPIFKQFEKFGLKED